MSFYNGAIYFGSFSIIFDEEPIPDHEVGAIRMQHTYNETTQVYDLLIQWHTGSQQYTTL